MIDLEHVDDHVEMYVAAMRSRVTLDGTTKDEPTLLHAMDRFAAARARIASREESGSPLVADEVFGLLGLGDSERQVIWFLAALAISKEARTLWVRGMGELGFDPTFSGIKSIVHGSGASQIALASLSATSRLRRLELIERSDGGPVELHESRMTWAVSRRILGLLHGDDSSTSGIEPLTMPRVALAIGDLAIRAVDREAALHAFHNQRAVVMASGTAGSGRRSLLAATAQELGMGVLSIDARKLANDFVRQLHVVARECKLLGVVPLIANIDALDAAGIALVGTELVAQLDGLVLVTCSKKRPAIRWDRPAILIELAAPSSEQLGQLWLRELGQGTASDGEVLATKYPLAPALIHHAAVAASARSNGDVTPDDIGAGLRAVLDDRLGEYASRVEVTQTWADLVLPQDQIDSIVELMARVRGRRRVYEQWGFGPKVGKGLGVSALFSGPPGTGKTMVAALIARDLGLEVYQVDLGKVVSKWIGETEKNLAAVFDSAEAGCAILLFDEADSLFGKRTEVKSSNDRNANLETNYLLQRLESFTGICLLTSNHESNIDPAFQRRLSLHVRFALPEPEERVQLWRAMLPQAAPVAPDIDFESLARRYEMSGGYIRNAALRAAFLAADEDTMITEAHLEHAARVEYENMGKLAI